MKIYKNLRIFTMDKEGKVYDNGYIKVSKGKILAIGNCDDLTCQELEAGECVDCKNKIAVPGMITAHAFLWDFCQRDAVIPADMQLAADADPYVVEVR